MDRGAWQATVQGVTVDTTERLKLNAAALFKCRQEWTIFK